MSHTETEIIIPNIEQYFRTTAKVVDFYYHGMITATE